MHMDTFKKLLAIGVLAGALGIGSASLASAQEADDSSTSTTVQSDDGSSASDSGSATADDQGSAPADAPDDANCPNWGGDASAAPTTAS
jgi:hypothetical protein